jgi:hypothetical protein
MSDQAPTAVEANQNSGIAGGGPTPTSFPLGNSSSYATPFSNSVTSVQKNSGSTAFGICLLILGVLGVLSTFMPWLSGNAPTPNGWDLRELMEEVGLFAQGAVVLAVGSAGTLVVAILLLANKNKAMNRFGVGIGILISGLTCAVGTGNTYNDLNETLGDSVNEFLGAGLLLGSVVAVAGMIAGILAMVIKPLTNSR